MGIKSKVRKFNATNEGFGFIIGRGLACTEKTMKKRIIPELRKLQKKFPELKDEDVILVVLLKRSGAKGSEPVIGLGLRFPIPKGASLPKSYVTLPECYEQRGNAPSEAESFSGFHSKKGGLSFYIGNTVGCSLVGVRSLFKIRKKDFPNTDPARVNPVFFSREPYRGKIGLRFLNEENAAPATFKTMSSIPRCVP
ncbi:MAG: hypothetical protein WCL23_01920 [Candidatus Moraniibacteriota bacterium]